MHVRILLVTNLYPPHALGGYEDLSASAVRHWKDAGHEVAVLTSDWHRTDIAADAPTPNGERVERLLPIHWDNNVMLRPGFVAAHRAERRAHDVLDGLVDDVRPDVVSIWNLAAMSFGMVDHLGARRVPVALVVGDNWMVWGLRTDPWTARVADRGPGGRALGRLVGAVTGLPNIPSDWSHVTACFCSASVRDRALATSRWRLAASPVVGFGVDLDRYPLTPRPPRPWQGRLLFVGRLDPRKGVHTLIQAMARLSDHRLEVIGIGEQEHTARLHDLVTKLGLEDRVAFLGEGGPAEITEAAARSDALVFPSEWEEPFGVVPLEGMALGLPVVATGTGGSGEFLVDAVTAVRFRAGDADDLVAGVGRLGEDDALRDRLVANGFRMATWLSREHSNARTLAWHEHAADPSTPVPDDLDMLPRDLDLP